MGAFGDKPGKEDRGLGWGAARSQGALFWVFGSGPGTTVVGLGDSEREDSRMIPTFLPYCVGL